MSGFYTVAVFCACGGHTIEMDVPGSQLDSKIHEFWSRHQAKGCEPIDVEEEKRLYNEWREQQIQKNSELLCEEGDL